MSASGSGVAPARAALAGNPSDLYGGAVLAVTIPAWSAEASAYPAPETRVEPPSALVEATVRRFARKLHSRASRAAITWRSSIPHTVGLGGSSALVIATTRALSEHCGVDQAPGELAEFALSVETEELGIVAGPQDRLSQAHGGLTFMDFTGEHPVCEALESSLLPRLLIAWQADARGPSGHVHAGACKAPYAIDIVARLADAARAARGALLAGDHEAFAAAMNRSVQQRGRLMQLDPCTMEMVRAARRCGAAANYTGSGGAIVAVAADDQVLRASVVELRALGCEVLEDPI